MDMIGALKKAKLINGDKEYAARFQQRKRETGWRESKEGLSREQERVITAECSRLFLNDK